jgi:endonuclease/exonuclease/phosphatase (EEP) superfamily protein YafD
MRVTILVFTVLFAVGAAALRWGVGHWHLSNPLWMVTSIGMTRIALVLGTLWIAWPTVRRPAMWFPPGILAVALIALGACVVQPRLAIAIIPALGTLLALAGFVRFFREQ